MRAVTQKQVRNLEKDISSDCKECGVWTRSGQGNGRPGERERTGARNQGKRVDWSSPWGVCFCAPSDWWRESSR